MSQVLIDTDKLYQYANRLSNVNYRLTQLQYRIDYLSYRVNDSTISSMARWNTLTSYKWKVTKCQSYLSQTASDFQRAEQQIINYNSSANRFHPHYSFSPLSTIAASGITALNHADNADVDAVNNSNGDKSWFAKFVNNKIKDSKAVISGNISGSGDFLGASTSGHAKGSLLYGEYGLKNNSKLSFDSDNKFDSWGIDIEGYLTGSVAEGEVEGKWGYLHGKASGDFLTGKADVNSKIKFSEDGRFNPSLFFGIGASASVLHGEVDLGFGTDQYGIHGSAEGDLLHAEVEANGGIGYLGKDKKGNSMYGIGGNVSALASAAQGEAKGGITIFGIDIDVGVEGYFAAVGVEAKGGITTNGAKFGLAGALGLGAGLDIEIDWTDAEWIGTSIDAVGGFIGDTASAVGDFASDAVDAVGDFASDAVDAVGDVASDAVDAVSNLFKWI